MVACAKTVKVMGYPLNVLNYISGIFAQMSANKSVLLMRA